MFIKKKNKEVHGFLSFIKKSTQDLTSNKSFPFSVF